MPTVVLLKITGDTSRERPHSQLAHAVVETGDKATLTCLRHRDIGFPTSMH